MKQFELWRKAGNHLGIIGNGETLEHAVQDALDNGRINYFEDVDTLEDLTSYVYTAHSDYLIKEINTHITKELLIKELNRIKNRSTWDRAVNLYAIELVESREDYNVLPTHKGNLEALLLNGAGNWDHYSEAGNSLISDYDIAKRCATPSHFKLSREGERRPNRSESWLELQGRALYQAFNHIYRIVRKYRGN